MPSHGLREIGVELGADVVEELAEVAGLGELPRVRRVELVGPVREAVRGGLRLLDALHEAVHLRPELTAHRDSVPRGHGAVLR